MPDLPASRTDVLTRVLRQVDRQMTALFGRSFEAAPDEPVWQPPVNLYESDDRYVLLIDLASADPDAIEVACSAECVAVRGRRCEVTPSDHRRVHMLEIEAGVFLREVPLPGPVDTSAVQATYRHGMLRIDLPKPR